MLTKYVDLLPTSQWLWYLDEILGSYLDRKNLFSVPKNARSLGNGKPVTVGASEPDFSRDVFSSRI